MQQFSNLFINGVKNFQQGWIKRSIDCLTESLNESRDFAPEIIKVIECLQAAIYFYKQSKKGDRKLSGYSIFLWDHNVSKRNDELKDAKWYLAQINKELLKEGLGLRH